MNEDEKNKYLRINNVPMNLWNLDDISLTNKKDNCLIVQDKEQSIDENELERFLNIFKFNSHLDSILNR